MRRTSSSSVAGMPGINAARELARRGVAVTLLEAHTLGWGASTRNGGIVHAGYKWSAGQLIKRYGQDTGTALYRETLDSYDLVKRLIAEEAIDCDFREVGHLELAYAPSHVPELEHARESLASVGVSVHGRAARADPRGDRHRRLLRGAGGGGERPAPSRALLRGAGGGRGAGRGRPARGRSGAVDPAAGRRAVRGRDVARRDPGGRRVRRHERLHGRRRARRCDAGSSRSARSSSRASRCRRTLAHELSPKGRAFFDTKNFLYYWHVSADRRMVFGGRASFLPTSIDKTARILHRGLLEVHPQLADYRIEYAWGGNVGFTFDRMPHVGRTKDGVAYAMGCCGTGVALMTHLGTRVGQWLAGGEAPALTRLRFPLVPAPYEGRPWFLPFAGEWFRLQDRLAARSRPKT